MTDIEKNLRGISPDGYLWLNIRSKHNEHNEKVQKDFREYAKATCEDDYTRALQNLLDYAVSDAKTEMLWDAINGLQAQIEELKAEHNVEEKPKSGKIGF